MKQKGAQDKAESLPVQRVHRFCLRVVSRSTHNRDSST